MPNLPNDPSWKNQAQDDKNLESLMIYLVQLQAKITELDTRITKLGG